MKKMLYPSLRPACFPVLITVTWDIFSTDWLRLPYFPFSLYSLWVMEGCWDGLCKQKIKKRHKFIFSVELAKMNHCRRPTFD